jgi:putative YphP/YqiW family bacilliredoxin
MPYPEIMIRPMREDLTRLGVEELRTPDAVDETIKNSKGTLRWL